MFLLTSARTFSAGEGIAYLLQQRGRAEVIGGRTAGAANPGRAYRINARFEAVIPNARVVETVSGGNWEGSGVAPDVATAAADALKIAHIRAVKKLLEAKTGQLQIERLRGVLRQID